MRYKMMWNNVKDKYEIWDLEPDMTFAVEPRRICDVEPKAVNALISKLIMHAGRMNQSVSASFVQLADEMCADFDDYVAILEGHRKQDEKQSLELIKEFVDTFGAAAATFTEVLGSFNQEVEAARKVMPKVVQAPPPNPQI